MSNLAVTSSPLKRQRGADLLVQALVDQGVEVVFGYPGGAIMPVYDALPGSPLRHILSRHEQGAVFAADGYARATGRPGVCLATSGPGATNLITGITNAYMDSVPLVAITGQASSGLIGTDAFQEAPIFGMTLPVVKHSYIVRRAEDIPSIVAEAFQLATSGRPRPVLIDLPKDVASAFVDLPKAFYPPVVETFELDQHALAKANALIAKAARPLFYVGGGVALGDAVEDVRELVERSGLPVVSTLKGLGTLPTDHPAFLGMLGMHGTRAANLAVQNCDLLICVGARFDDRATGKLSTFAPEAAVIHLDADASEIGKLRRAEVALCGELKRYVQKLVPHTGDVGAWKAQLATWKKSYPWRYDAPGDGVYAPALLKALSEAADNAIFTCDVGQHQMWVAQHCRLSHPRAHLSSGGLGAMGYGVPAGIGAKLACPDATVITVTGDGSIMMSIQELATLKRYGVALKIVLLDNSSLGMVRQWQELFFDGNYSEVDLSDNPDFVKVAEAFGIEAFAVRSKSEIDAGIQRLLAARGPVLMHVPIDPKSNVWPLVPPGKSNAEMMERGL